MKTQKKLLKMIFLVFLILLGLSICSLSRVCTANENKVTPGEFVVEPPTLISLGFEWYIQGDDNGNAMAEVWYNKKGDGNRKKALPLLRIKNEVSKCRYGRFNTTVADWYYVAPNMFAGSIFDLEPDTEYECLFVMSDPDGVIGNPSQKVSVRTRAEPKPFAGGNVYHAYPFGYTGPQMQPAFTGLLDAYYTGYSHYDWNKASPPRVVPGDTILMHAGVYKDDRFRYLSPVGYGTPFDGTYYLTASGTAEKPITIKAAGDGEVIFDGGGCHNLFNVMGANYNYFEGLTIRNTDIAFWAGIKNLVGSSGLTVKRCRFEDVGAGVWTEYSGSKNFYIADNVMIGREAPGYLMGWISPPWEGLPGFPAPLTSYFGVKVYGSGHVVCYNYITRFHDGIDFDTYGLPDGYPNVPRDRMPVSNDFYNNDLSHFADNCIEADGSMHNMRVFRNRCMNSSQQATSNQPTFAGPTYHIRNITYNNWNGAVKWSYSQGAIYYHNTFLSGAIVLSTGGSTPGSNFHFRNNLILGQNPSEKVFEMGTFTNYSTSDYNGFRPNGKVQYSFQWNSPPFNIAADYVNPLVVRQFPTLAAYSRDTGQDAHSILVDWDMFTNVSPIDYTNPRLLYNPSNYDFTLKPNAKAVDAGVILPNVNDDFTGNAPDLGALEVGRPVPHYGPQP